MKGFDLVLKSLCLCEEKRPTLVWETDPGEESLAVQQVRVAYFYENSLTGLDRARELLIGC